MSAYNNVYTLTSNVSIAEVVYLPSLDWQVKNISFFSILELKVLLQPYLPASEENAAMKSTEGGKNHDTLGLCATKLKICKKKLLFFFDLEDLLIRK